MELAHTLGTGGPEIEFMILAAAMLVLGIVFFFQKGVKPVVPLILVLGAFALSAGAFIFKSDTSTAPAAGIDAVITIESPAPGDTVPANEPLQLSVDLQGGRLTAENASDDPREGHLHVYVDGELVSMPTEATPEVELEPGSHEITVEFTQADHRSFEPRILDTVEVTAE